MQNPIRYLIVVLLFAASSFAGVTISSPVSGSTDSSPVHFAASASSSLPITAMRIYVDNNSVYLTSSNQINTSIPMAVGAHNVVVQAWDTSGAVFKAAETVTVTTGSSANVTVSAPANNASVNSPFQVVASASGPNPITAIQIYLDNQLFTTVQGSTLNVPVNAATGTHSLVVQAWDSTGATYKNFETVNVSGTTSGTKITVSTPTNNATVSSPFNVTASASGSNPVTTMQIYLDGQLATTVQAASLNTSVSAGAGAHALVIQALDSTGAVTKDSLSITVNGSVPSNATVQSNIESMAGWQSCTVCAGSGGNGPVAGMSLAQFQATPSQDGDSAKFSIWGSTPYSDALWWKELGPDNSATNFQYDVDFYLTTPQDAQALEFDVNQSDGTTRFIFGTQCNIKNGAVFDVWDTAGGRWMHTGVPCPAPSANTWHHLTWQLKRSASQATFVSVTLDGVTHPVNMTFNGKPASGSELNVAFQMDGDSAQHAYSTWLDKVSLTYW